MDELKALSMIILLLPVIIVSWASFALKWILYPYAILIWFIAARGFLLPDDFAGMIGKPFEN